MTQVSWEIALQGSAKTGLRRHRITVSQRSSMPTRLLIIFLVVLIAALHYRLWFGEGSLPEAWSLRQSVALKLLEVKQLEIRNRALEAEVKDLRLDTHAVEERARSELGMIRKGETFYQIIESTGAKPSPATADK